MMLTIFRGLAAFVTFFIGISFVLIFTAFYQIDDISNMPVPEIHSLPPILSVLPESADLAQSPSEIIFDYDPTKFYPRGTYFLLGKKPKDFREFDGFELAAYEWDRMTSSDKPSGHIMFWTNSNGVENIYYTETGSVTDKQVTFIAAPMFEEDFEYRFNGHFLKGGRIYKASKNQAVLKGKLIKLKTA